MTLEGPRAKLGFERKIIFPAKIVYGYGNNPSAKLVDEAGNHAPAVQLSITTGKPPAMTQSAAPHGAGGR